ncbi:MAG TPA: FAD-dependent oxidoreductase [Thermoanaerobaculia bacterium]|nr:FAD-dependent oxidoreductase [Thermoanaerobaculia bacterium]
MRRLRRLGIVKSDFDVAIVGSGFAGSLLAMACRRLGRSVVLVERGSHPRFAIGESSSPLANLLLEEICDRYGLDRIRPLSSWGSWRKTRPEIACGLKRGFTFYWHTPGRPFAADPERGDQLLVAASPNDEVADTHWYRADFDAFLADEARGGGAEYLDQTRLDSMRASPGGGGGWVLEGERGGRRLALAARFVADATGPAGFLHRALALPAGSFASLPDTQALYTHFSGVRRLDETRIFESAEAPPYPVDDAAVHHVFEGGWIWILRFNNGITSAGVSAAPELAEELRLSDGEAAWPRLLGQLPSVERQFEGARAVMPFVHRRRLPFRSAAAAGEGWALLPSAAAFVDPLLSTGFPLTLLGVLRLARAIERSWGGKSFAEELRAYEKETLFEADAAGLLIAAMFSSLGDFPLFAALSRLYFAAASFAEAERRLGRNPSGRSFLCADHPVFGPAFRDCCRAALAPRQDREDLLRRIAAAIEPIDIAGLGDRGRRNWHPVLASDLLSGAGKVGASGEEIESLLERSGFLAPAAPAPEPDNRMELAP